jgi:CysZ protein
MGFWSDFSLGFKTYSDAHRFIRKHNLWGYIGICGLINIILFAAFVWVIVAYSDNIADYVLSYFGLNEQGDSFWNYFFSIFRILMIIGLYIIFFFIYLFTYQIFVLTILSPFLAYLSEKTEQIIDGTEYPFNFKQYLYDLFRGNYIALRNTVLEFIWIIILFFVSFIPVIGFLSPIAVFVISMYFYGFSMIDYCSERHRMKVKESIRYVRKHKGFAISNGLVFYLVILIPVVGIIVAPTYSCVAATIGDDILRKQDEQKLIIRR